MNQTQKKLLLEIVRNEEVQQAFDAVKKGKETDSPYAKIVKAQIDAGIKKLL